MTSREIELNERQQSTLERVTREFLEKQRKGEIVIGGVNYQPQYDREWITFNVAPSKPLFDLEEIESFTNGLLSGSIDEFSNSRFRTDRETMYAGGYKLSEKAASTKTTITYDPVDSDLMKEIGVTVKSGELTHEGSITRIIEVIAFPHPRLAQIASEHFPIHTDLARGIISLASLRKIQKCEASGKPFPVEDFRIPERIGR